MGVERLGKHEEQTTDKPALPEAEPLDFSGYKLRNGHSKKTEVITGLRTRVGGYLPFLETVGRRM